MKEVNSKKNIIKGGLFFNNMNEYFFKPEGSIPLSWTHIKFFVLTLAIFLYFCENTIIVIVRKFTEYLFPINMNIAINPRWFVFFTLFAILILKFISVSKIVYERYFKCIICILLIVGFILKISLMAGAKIPVIYLF